MAVPDVALTITDGALGIVTAGGENTVALVGPCSAGTANVAATYANTPALVAALGQGPLVDAAAHILDISGGPVICVKATSSAGTNGSVTAVQTGTATLALSGAPLDAYRLKILCVQGGASLVAVTATFKYSLDAGTTYSQELSIPTGGVYVIPNTGVTLTWTYASGTAFVAGDYWTATEVPPTNSLSQITTAMDVIIQDATLTPFMIKVVGEAATVGDAATMFASLATKMSGAATTWFKYAYVHMDTPSTTDALTIAAFVSSADTRVAVSGGFEYLTSPLSGAVYKRSVGWSAAARAALARAGDDLGKVRTGPCAGVVSLDRDEYKTPALDAARFTTMRTIVGKPGFFITNGRIMSTVGSDFTYIQNRRVMDIACRITRAGMLEYLNDSVRVSASTGLILEADARAIDARITSLLSAALLQPKPQYASDVVATVDRTINVLSTSSLYLKVRVTPLGYLKAISVDMGFVNPALLPV